MSPQGGEILRVTQKQTMQKITVNLKDLFLIESDPHCCRILVCASVRRRNYDLPVALNEIWDQQTLLVSKVASNPKSFCPQQESVQDLKTQMSNSTAHIPLDENLDHTKNILLN